MQYILVITTKSPLSPYHLNTFPPSDANTQREREKNKENIEGQNKTKDTL